MDATARRWLLGSSGPEQRADQSTGREVARMKESTPCKAHQEQGRGHETESEGELLLAADLPRDRQAFAQQQAAVEWALIGQLGEACAPFVTERFLPTGERE